MNRPEPPSDEPNDRQRHLIWFWAAALGLFVVWNLVAANVPAPPATISYTALVGQVAAGNVSEIRLTGDQITGTFRRPFAPAPGASPVTQFGASFPQAVGDPSFMPLAQAHHVTIDVSSAQANPWIGLLIAWGPALVLLGIILWMSRSAGGKFRSSLGFGKINPVRYGEGRQQRVTFADVAGAEEAKAELEEEVDFLRRPEKYHEIGAHIPKGVLLSGSPGSGKTLLARAVAGEAGVPFLSLNASEFVEMFVGIGASRVRDLFAQAKSVAPAIVFIDELDAVGRRRGAGIGNVNDEREQTLNQLLGELDGFDPQANIVVLAATNRPDVLDPALLRPGRFDRLITVALPDRQGRAGILRIHARTLKVGPAVDYDALARQTIGMSGADLANVCNEAALSAVRHDRQAVVAADFAAALDRVRLGSAQARLLDAEERRGVAYHESGHALVAWLTPDADPVEKMTIIPHGQALGVTEQVPTSERHNLARKDVEVRLAVMLGGRAAEELVIGDVTSGAESDLVAATQLARQMVTRWGMSEVGLAAFRVDESQPFLGFELTQQGRDYSEATAARVDAEVQRLLASAHDRAAQLLGAARPQLEILAEALLNEETLDLDRLQALLGARPGAGSVPA